MFVLRKRNKSLTPSTKTKTTTTGSSSSSSPSHRDEAEGTEEERVVEGRSAARVWLIESLYNNLLLLLRPSNNKRNNNSLLLLHKNDENHDDDDNKDHTTAVSISSYCYGGSCAPWRKWRRRRKLCMMLVLGGALAILIMSRLMYKYVDYIVRWTRLPKYNNVQEQNFRKYRFPTVNQRVKLYMNLWYWYPSLCRDGRRGGVLEYEKVIVRTTKKETNYTSSHSQRQQFVFYSDRNEAYFMWEPDHEEYYYKVRKMAPSTSSSVKTGGGNEEDVAETTKTTAVSTYYIPKKVQLGRMFVLDRQELRFCFTQRKWSNRFYCHDALESVVPLLLKDTTTIPIFCQFSDETDSVAYSTPDFWQQQEGGENTVSNPPIPHLKKLRYAYSKSQLETLQNMKDDDDDNNDCRQQQQSLQQANIPYQPILWLLNINRHFKHSRDVWRHDRPYHEKLDQAVFRGLLTGLEFDRSASDDDKCQRLIRCQVVYEYAHSEFVNAKLTSVFKKLSSDIYRGVNMTGTSLTKAEILRYKGIVVLEGNDVSSSLKWSMVSNSVVLMPRKLRYTSWAMEELLEPWVHYIPFDNVSDIGHKVQWMIQHPAESQRISHRAKLWVLDLYYHPDAMKESQEINRQILDRYRRHFRPAVLATTKLS